VSPQVKQSLSPLGPVGKTRFFLDFWWGALSSALSAFEPTFRFSNLHRFSNRSCCRFRVRGSESRVRAAPGSSGPSPGAGRVAFSGGGTGSAGAPGPGVVGVSGPLGGLSDEKYAENKELKSVSGSSMRNDLVGPTKSGAGVSRAGAGSEFGVGDASSEFGMGEAGSEFGVRGSEFAVRPTMDVNSRESMWRPCASGSAPACGSEEGVLC